MCKSCLLYTSNKGQGKEPGLVKKVTVEISYKSGKEDKKVELSTVLSKEN